MEKYEQLKSIIQQANPDFYKRLMQVNQGAGVEITVRDENIRLADVLLAISQIVPRDAITEIRDKNGSNRIYFGEGIAKCIHHWNLKYDNLDHQSDETKQFLIDLLVK